MGRGYLETADLLILNGAEVHAYIDALFTTAAAAGDLKMVVKFLSYRPNIRAYNDRALIYMKTYLEEFDLPDRLAQANEIMALLVGRMGKDAPEPYAALYQNHLDEAERAATLFYPGRADALIDAEGKSTLLLRILAASGTLDHFFRLASWEAPAQAREFLDECREALPDYLKHAVHHVDMTAFRPEAPDGGMVSRLRERETSLPKGRR